KFPESISIEACCEELLDTQHNNFRCQQKLTAFAALATALTHCSDAVEITNDKFQIQVINLINVAQENSNPTVAAALDRVLEILHQSTDLYTGELPSTQEDKMTSDYVGGLMTGGSKPPEKKRQVMLQPRQNSSSNIQSLSEIPEELLAYLDNDDDWSFDIIELERVTEKKPMVYLAMKTLQRFNVCHFLQCSEDTMLKWLQVIQDHYHADNCYHNATHGADVMQSSAYFLERDRIKSIFDEMDEVASLLGALVHDLDHPGRTNPFLINSQHKLAILYNDITVLESHHVSLAFQLTTRDDRINIFKNMSREDYKTLRQSMIDIVLATEMAKHFEHVGKFANQIVAPLVAKEGEEGAERITEEEALEMLTKSENRTLIKRVLIKCSDTDEEKSKGLPIVMPVFDRTTCNMPHSQTSFIDFFLREMFSAWHAFCDVPQLVENLNNNYAYWKQLADENKRAEEAMREAAESEEEAAAAESADEERTA
uniref:Phosphodiesterase n=1 Tax=Macrostomum lignano TaxID=282301 RepID=A0A1I8IRR7_9PLAT